jgi:alkylated DNA repair dioxygenase AlkB
MECSPPSGIRYIREYLAPATHDTLLSAVDAHEWQMLGERRVQAHGYSWNRTTGGVYRIGALPAWAKDVADHLLDDRLMPYAADQVIVNEFEPGAGIPAHVDAAFFDDTIVSLSLGSTCIIEFVEYGLQRVHPLLLEPRSALVMTGDARTRWAHGIPARECDVWCGQQLQRARRVSLTFRRMLTP